MKGAFVSTLNKKDSNLQAENELCNDVSIAIKYKKGRISDEQMGQTVWKSDYNRRIKMCANYFDKRRSDGTMRTIVKGVRPRRVPCGSLRETLRPP